MHQDQEFENILVFEHLLMRTAAAMAVAES